MLKDNIPNFCYTIKQVKDIIDAIQPEIDRINEELDKMKSDVHITTTSVIERFERDYGIVPDISKSLEDRILALLNLKNIKNTFTDEQLRALVSRNYKSDKFQVIFDYPDYSFNILLQDDKPINNLLPALEKAKPAHLAFLLSLLIGCLKITIKGTSIIISNLIRRCGTFNCGVDPL